MYPEMGNTDRNSPLVGSSLTVLWVTFNMSFDESFNKGRAIFHRALAAYLPTLLREWSTVQS
jgi:hypothetical protein